MQSSVRRPFTLYWMEYINYLKAGLLAIITEKQGLHLGPFLKYSCQFTSRPHWLGQALWFFFFFSPQR